MEEKTLEELFEEIDGIIAKMEGEDLSLEQSFGLYESGIRMLQDCNARIEQVEKKILMMNAQGELETEL